MITLLSVLRISVDPLLSFSVVCTFARFLGFRHIFTTPPSLPTLIFLSTLIWLPETNKYILELREYQRLLQTLPTAVTDTSGPPKQPVATRNLAKAFMYQFLPFVMAATLLGGTAFGSYYAFPG